MNLSRVRRIFVWGVAAVPVAMLGVVLYLHALPADLRQHVVKLAGEFKRTTQDQPELAHPALDDSGWETAQLPAFKSAHGELYWARRHFQAPEGFLDKSLYFAAGGLWPGTEIFLNGIRIGKSEEYVRGGKVEDFGLEGWDVPAGALRAGDNVLAMRMTAWVLHDSRLLLGERDQLRPYTMLNTFFKGLVLHGVLFLLGFFAVLLSVFYVQEEATEHRMRYRAALHMVLASGLYVATNAGIFALPEFSPVHVLLIFLGILYYILAVAEFFELYFLKRASWMRWVVRGAFGLFALVQVGLFAAGRHNDLFRFWDLVPARFLGIPLIWSLISGIRGARREWQAMGPLLAVAVSTFFLASVLDVLTVQQVTSFPRLSPLATGSLAIISSVMITGDFLKISYLNKDLSRSLVKTNSDLADALVKAQEAARVKGEFVANVSHELRTPLNSIVNIPEGLLGLFGNARLARCSACSSTFECAPEEVVDQGTACPDCARTGTLQLEASWRLVGDPAEVVSHLTLLERSGRNLLSLIDHVLDFSKLEAGRMTLVPEELTLKSVVEEVVANMTPLAAQRSVTLEVQPFDGGWSLRADRVKLSQILVNLLGNAVKFSPEKGTITIRAALGAEACEIGVEDRGIGIPPDAQKVIFESFRQVDGSHTRKFGGTGLGLAITKQLVELHGGSIRVESEVDRGSTFLVRLPKAGPGEPSKPVVAEARSGASKVRTVLVVDDEPVAVEAVKLALRPLGHRVVGLTDPRHFLETVKQESPDLIILDVMMPRLSGLTLLQQLRDSPAWRNTPVLVASAYHANEDLVVAQRAAWLSKPWQSSQLMLQVKALLGEAPQEGAPPPPAAAPPADQGPKQAAS